MLLAGAGVVATVWLAAHLLRYLLADAEIRSALRVGWRIRWTWRRTTVRVGLVQAERVRPPLWSSRPHTNVVRRELVPAVRVRARRWGVEVDASTVGRLGLVEFQNAAGHLADAWRVPQVRVAQVRPGLVVWHVGPSASWPLVVVVIDEAHTFFNGSKGTDVESKKRDAVARQTTRLVEELVRKGRNVGIQVILATQKATGDAISTKIRELPGRGQFRAAHQRGGHGGARLGHHRLPG